MAFTCTASPLWCGLTDRNGPVGSGCGRCQPSCCHGKLPPAMPEVTARPLSRCRREWFLRRMPGYTGCSRRSPAPCQRARCEGRERGRLFSRTLNLRSLRRRLQSACWQSSADENRGIVTENPAVLTGIRPPSTALESARVCRTIDAFLAHRDLVDRRGTDLGRAWSDQWLSARRIALASGSADECLVDLGAARRALTLSLAAVLRMELVSRCSVARTPTFARAYGRC